MKSHRQSGYVLLSILVLLLSVGGGWLGMAATAQQSSSFSVGLSFNDAQALIDSRQALLSYAALYPFLYGPAGAGAAHFPCPDTDGYDVNSPAAESGLAQRRDGPNPPCSSLVSSEGWLPRHVKLPGNRYAFHAQPRQRFHYQVDGALVNNPLNRIVNVKALRVVDAHHGAIIRLLSAQGEKAKANVALTRRSLIEVTAASVAAWVIQKSRKYPLSVCRLPATAGQANSAPAGGTSTSTCNDTQALLSVCNSQEVLELLLDTPQVSDGCLIDNLDTSTLEGVPARRHWFVRNQWHQWLVLVYGEGCTPASKFVPSCQLTYPRESRAAIARGGLSIALHWSMPL